MNHSRDNRSTRIHRDTAYLGLLLLLLSSPRWAFAGTALSEIRRRGEVVIGTDATYPPFEEKVGDGFRGFDIDLGNAIARELGSGVRARWVNISFDGIFAALLSSKFDLITSGVTITSKRQKQMAFSEPYYHSGQIIAVRKGDTSIQKPEDLRGRKVAVQINTTGQDAMEAVGGVTVRKYNDLNLALLDVTSGRADAAVGDLPAVREMIRKGHPRLMTVGGLLSNEVVGIVMRPGEPELLTAVNDALRRVRASGEYDRIYERWLREKTDTTNRSGAPPALFRLPLLAHVWPSLLWGAWWTLRLTLLSLLFGTPLGLLAALGRLSHFYPVSMAAGFYVEVIRGTPLLVQIFFIYYVLPVVGISLPEVPAALVALSVNCGAYIAEIFRAGIQSIDVGQMEAARSLGMTYPQSMRLVVLPQAIRRVLPPLTNEAIALLKDSSLVSLMAMTELTRRGQELSSSYAAPMTIWPAVALLYLLMTLPLTRLAQYLEVRWRPVSR
jgi:arginine/lysine/histidine/glutamine transport system substrate-binding/permease protein